MEGIVLDLARYTLFIIILYALVFSHKTNSSYHAFHTVRNLVVFGTYSETIPIGRVISYDQFLEYVNKTLIRTLLRNSTTTMNLHTLEEGSKHVLPEGFEDVFPNKRIANVDTGGTNVEEYDNENDDNPEEDVAEEDPKQNDDDPEEKYVVLSQSSDVAEEDSKQNDYIESMPPGKPSPEILDYIKILQKTREESSNEKERTIKPSDTGGDNHEEAQYFEYEDEKEISLLPIAETIKESTEISGSAETEMKEVSEDLAEPPTAKPFEKVQFIPNVDDGLIDDSVNNIRQKRTIDSKFNRRMPINNGKADSRSEVEPDSEEITVGNKKIIKQNSNSSEIKNMPQIKVEAGDNTKALRARRMVGNAIKPILEKSEDDDYEDLSNDFEDDEDIIQGSNFEISDLPESVSPYDNTKIEAGKRVVTPEKIAHRKNINLYDPSTSALPLHDRSWTVDPSFKLIGKIRMRQVRVQKESCHSHEDSAIRTQDCTGPLSYFNVETDSFGLSWQEKRLEDPTDTDYDFDPWKYKTSFETGDFRYIAEYSSYPGGGYVLPLGKSITNARNSLEYMRYFNWIDMKTRAIFIDFTLYSVDANIFSVCTLVFEVGAHGVFIPSYYIYSSPLIFAGPYASIFIFILGIIFFVLIFCFFVREGIRLRRTDLKAYVTHGWPVLDLAVAVLGLILTMVYVARTIYITEIMQELATKPFNDYFSFKSVVFLDRLAHYTSAIMVSLVTIKIFQLFSFHLILYRFDAILHFEFKYFFGAFIIYMSIVATYAILFNGSIGTMNDRYFNNLLQGIPYTMTLSERATDLDSLFYEYPPGLAQVTILFLVMFLSIFAQFNVGTMLVRYRRFALKPLRSTYQMWPYLQRIFLKNGTTDLPKITGLPKEEELISLVKKDTVNPPLLINEVRCQAMKRLVIETLSGIAHKEQTARNMASIALTSDDQRPALDHFLIGEDDKQGLRRYVILTHQKIENMKDIAKEVIKQKNDELTEQIRSL